MRNAANYTYEKITKFSSNIEQLEPWFDVRHVSNVSQLSSEYQDLCLKHERNNKWILMVDAEVDSLRRVSHDQFDKSKVLLVNSNKVKVNLAAIETALCSGNCSAVILCDSMFEDEQIEKLCESARRGKTKCILLNRSNKLH